MHLNYNLRCGINLATQPPFFSNIVKTLQCEARPPLYYYLSLYSSPSHPLTIYIMSSTGDLSCSEFIHSLLSYPQSTVLRIMYRD